MINIRNTLLILVIAFFGVALTAQAADIKLGVVAPRGIIKANEKWSALAEYIGNVLNKNVTLVPVTPDKVENAVKFGIVDFFLGNPVLTTILVEKLGAPPVATLEKNSGSQFAGVILSKKNSRITRSRDLKGKNVMAFKFGTSAAAYVFQVYHLSQQGIDPHQDFASFREAKKQDDIVLAVRVGAIDVGFVKTGLLESMAKEGKINMNDFTIVDQKKDGFPLVHSTSLYPEWYLVAKKSTNPEDIQSVKQAVLSLQSDHPAAKAAKIKGFVEPLDLSEMKATLKTLGLEPYG